MTESSKASRKRPEDLSSEEEARRSFLKKTGRFAAVTPPAVAFLLGTSLNSRAIAASSGSESGSINGLIHGHKH
jgi:formiminotetrahydrofolate cyclodeaminase